LGIASLNIVSLTIAFWHPAAWGIPPKSSHQTAKAFNQTDMAMAKGTLPPGTICAATGYILR
jgi:hypothetical protein